MKKPSILITSVGSRAAEGIIACLEPLRSQIRVVATNSIPEAPGLFDADVAYLVPATADTPAFEARIREILVRERTDLVINGRDDEVEILSRLLPSIPHKPGFLGPPEDISGIFNDKYKTAQFAQANDLPFAPTAITATEIHTLVEQYGFPLIAKPRKGGFASRDVFVLTKQEQLEAVLTRGGFVVQPFLYEGNLSDPISDWENALGIPWIWNPLNTFHLIELVIGRDGSVVSVCASKAERDGSIVKKLKIIDDKDIRRIADKHCAVFSAAGHQGPVNVQGVRLGGDEFIAFEWNARFGGSAPGYALMGVNQVMMAVLDRFPDLKARPLHGPGLHSVFRPFVFRAVLNSDVKLLREEGCWKETRS